MELRLADDLEKHVGGNIAYRSAAALRHLYEAHDWQYKMAGQRLRRIEKLEAQNQELVEALQELLRVEATHDDGEIILEVARHNAKAALAKAKGEE
jgi:hypothetical protein